MLTYSIYEIAQATGGVVLQGDPGITVGSVSIDSRSAREGDLFIALKGSRVDGHDYIPNALQSGVRAVMTDRELSDIPQNIGVVLVPDTMNALQRLAEHNRDAVNIPVIAVTGSNGKTSTKDMLASVLGIRFKTLKTEGNFNNELGLPLTLLKLNKEHQVAVIELGMRGPGEIDFLARIAKPTAAVITNIGEAHIERLGSIENIARAKGEVLEHINEEGFALLHAESPYLEEQARRCRGEVWFFSVEGRGDIVADQLKAQGEGVSFRVTYPGGQGEVYLPTPGRHNVSNSLAAIGVGLKLGLTFAEIARGLEAVTLTHMRLEVLRVNGTIIINDAYNASPTSMKAAIKVLKEIPATRKIAVLGNMFELGDFSRQGHLAVGEAAARAGIDYLFTLGDLAEDIALGAASMGLGEDRIYRCSGNQEAIKLLLDTIGDGDAVLIKGSRGMRMEEVVKALLQVSLSED